MKSREQMSAKMSKPEDVIADLRWESNSLKQTIVNIYNQLNCEPEDIISKINMLQTDCLAANLLTGKIWKIVNENQQEHVKISRIKKLFTER